MRKIHVFCAADMEPLAWILSIIGLAIAALGTSDGSEIFTLFGLALFFVAVAVGFFDHILEDPKRFPDLLRQILSAAICVAAIWLGMHLIFEFALVATTSPGLPANFAAILAMSAGWMGLAFAWTSRIGPAKWTGIPAWVGTAGRFDLICLTLIGVGFLWLLIA